MNIILSKQIDIWRYIELREKNDIYKTYVVDIENENEMMIFCEIDYKNARNKFTEIIKVLCK